MHCPMRKLALPMLLAIFLVGCGGSDDNTVPPEEINYPEFISNSGKTTNLLGHYGDEVYFGDQKIVGKWHGFYIPEGGEALLSGIADTDYIFNNDGTGYYSPHQDLTGTSSSFKYGIDNSAILIISNGNGSSLKIYSIAGYKDNCFKISLTDIFTVTYPNPEIDAGNYQPFYLCKVE